MPHIVTDSATSGWSIRRRSVQISDISARSNYRSRGERLGALLMLTAIDDSAWIVARARSLSIAALTDTHDSA